MAPALGRAALTTRAPRGRLAVRAQAAPPPPPGGPAPKGRKPVSASVLKNQAPAPVSPPPVDGALDVDEASEPDAFAELVALNVRKQSVNRRQDVSCFGKRRKP
jgi:hypothetical protein